MGRKRRRLVDLTGRLIGRGMNADQIGEYVTNFGRGHKAGRADQFIGHSTFNLKDDDNLRHGYAEGYWQGNRKL